MARIYDEKWMPSGRPNEVNERNSVFENLHVRDKLVLDLGAGTLRFTLEAIRRGARQVIAVDVEREMLKWGIKENANLEIRGKVDTVVADCANLPFVNDVFDTAIAIELTQYIAPKVLHHFVNEVHRVLRQSGSAAINTWNAIPRIIAGLLGYTEKGVEIRKARSSSHFRWENYYRFSYPWEFKHLMQLTDFKVVKFLGVHSTYFLPQFEMMTLAQISKASKWLKLYFFFQTTIDKLFRKIRPLNLITGRILIVILAK